MTTENPDTRRALPRGLHSVPAPRTGVPALRPPGDPAPEPASALAVDDSRDSGSRAVKLFVGFLIATSLVAGMVAYRIIVPAPPSESGAGVTTSQSGPEEWPGASVTFGQEHTYGDGLALVVGNPQPYKPTANATGLDEGEPTRVQVVVTNGTDEAFRPNTMLVSATSGGQEATGVWDPDQGIALTGPDVSVPAGGELSFYLAFAVQDPADLRLEISPALAGYAPVVVARS